MVLNKRGQQVFFLLMLGVTIIVLALALIQPTMEFINDARNETTDTRIGLNCSSDLISDYDKATCITTDLALPYFIGGLIFLGGAVIGYKLLYE